MGDPDLLGAGEGGRAQRRGGSVTVSSIVSSLPTPKALSFLYTLCLFDGGEF